MQKQSLRVVFLSICFVCAMVAQAQPKNNRPNYKSTEILSDSSAAFRIYAPNAKNVTITSGDKWDKIEFKKGDNGVWEGIWNNLQPGAYRYSFVVDGVQVNDPMSPFHLEQRPVFLMSSGNDYFDRKDDVPHGAMAQRYYYSETLKKTRRMHVWTPAGYEKGKDKLPVLYLIHGGGDTDLGWPAVGCAGNILDNLLAEEKIEPMIVVMPNGSVDVETQTMLEKVPVFTDGLLTAIIPFVESNYRVYDDARHRAIMGLSFGGLETLEAATLNPHLFDYVVALSSGWWLSESWRQQRGDNWMDSMEKRRAHMNAIGEEFNKSVKLMYFTQGGSEDLAYENGLETMKIFEDAGIKFQFSEMPGGHTWKVWRKNLWDIAPLLFK